MTERGCSRTFSTSIPTFSSTSPPGASCIMNQKDLFSNVNHITCLAHAVHNVCETIRDEFDLVNDFIGKTKRFLSYSKEERNNFREEVGSLPPDPVITRWETFLKAAQFYYNHLTKAKSVIEKSDSQSKGTKQLKKSGQQQESWKSIHWDWAIFFPHSRSHAAWNTKRQIRGSVCTDQWDAEQTNRYCKRKAGNGVNKERWFGQIHVRRYASWPQKEDHVCSSRLRRCRTLFLRLQVHSQWSQDSPRWVQLRDAERTQIQFQF